MYYRSWAPENGHKPSSYKAEIEGKLARYRASPASKVGREFSRSHMEKPKPGSDPSDAVDYVLNGDIRDTKLVLQYYSNGSPPQLWYYKRDYDGSMAAAPFGGALMDPSVDLDHSAKDAGFQPYKRVEDEFRDFAIANNERAWKVKYDVKIVDTSSRDMDKLGRKAAQSPTPAEPVQIPDELRLMRSTASDETSSPVMNVD